MRPVFDAKYYVVDLNDYSPIQSQNCVCVPTSWIKSQDGIHVCVPYPKEDIDTTLRRIENKEGDQTSWQHYWGSVLKKTDSFEEAKKYTSKLRIKFPNFFSPTNLDKSSPSPLSTAATSSKQSHQYTTKNTPGKTSGHERYSTSKLKRPAHSCDPEEIDKKKAKAACPSSQTTKGKKISPVKYQSNQSLPIQKITPEIVIEINSPISRAPHSKSTNASSTTQHLINNGQISKVAINKPTGTKSYNTKDGNAMNISSVNQTSIRQPNQPPQTTPKGRMSGEDHSWRQIDKLIESSVVNTPSPKKNTSNQSVINKLSQAQTASGLNNLNIQKALSVQNSSDPYKVSNDLIKSQTQSETKRPQYELIINDNSKKPEITIVNTAKEISQSTPLSKKEDSAILQSIFNMPEICVTVVKEPVTNKSPVNKQLSEHASTSNTQIATAPLTVHTTPQHKVNKSIIPFTIENILCNSTNYQSTKSTGENTSIQSNTQIAYQQYYPVRRDTKIDINSSNKNISQNKHSIEQWFSTNSTSKTLQSLPVSQNQLQNLRQTKVPEDMPTFRHTNANSKDLGAYSEKQMGMTLTVGQVRAIKSREHLNNAPTTFSCNGTSHIKSSVIVQNGTCSSPKSNTLDNSHKNQKTSEQTLQNTNHTIALSSDIKADQAMRSVSLEKRTSPTSISNTYANSGAQNIQTESKKNPPITQRTTVRQSLDHINKTDKNPAIAQCTAAHQSLDNLSKTGKNPVIAQSTTAHQSLNNLNKTEKNLAIAQSITAHQSLNNLSKTGKNPVIGQCTTAHQSLNNLNNTEKNSAIAQISTAHQSLDNLSKTGKKPVIALSTTAHQSLDNLNKTGKNPVIAQSTTAHQSLDNLNNTEKNLAIAQSTTAHQSLDDLNKTGNNQVIAESTTAHQSADNLNNTKKNTAITQRTTAHQLLHNLNNIPTSSSGSEPVANIPAVNLENQATCSLKSNTSIQLLPNGEEIIIDSEMNTEKKRILHNNLCQLQQSLNNIVISLYGSESVQDLTAFSVEKQNTHTTNNTAEEPAIAECSPDQPSSKKVQEIRQVNIDNQTTPNANFNTTTANSNTMTDMSSINDILQNIISRNNQINRTLGNTQKIVNTLPPLLKNMTKIVDGLNKVIINTPSTSKVMPKTKAKSIMKMKRTNVTRRVKRTSCIQGSITPRFVLPLEFNADYTRWTLKYQMITAGIMELEPNSQVYIRIMDFARCQRVAKDYKDLARELIPEIFTKTALHVCSLTGQQYSKNDDQDVRPGLDANALKTIITFIQNHSRKKNWPVPDEKLIMNFMSTCVRRFNI